MNFGQNMGMNPMGMNPMGMNPMGMNTMGMNPMGMDPTMGMNPMGMNPMGMNPMGMNPMGMNPMGMNPMGMNPMGINPMGINPMGMNPMGINPMGMNKNVTIGDNEGWNLIFEDKKGNKRITVTISPDKTVQEAINIYKIKANLDDNQAKFIFNGKSLCTTLTLSQSGLNNNNVITVVTTKNVIGA